MAKMAMDFKQFKKVNSDKNTTTLRHNAGHEIKIAHSALNAEDRASLEKLPVHKFAEGTPDAVQSDGPDLESVPVNVSAPVIPEEMANPSPIKRDQEITKADKSKELPDTYGVSKEDWSKELARHDEIQNKLNQPPQEQQVSPQAPIATAPNSLDSYLNNTQNAYGLETLGAQQQAQAAGNLGKQQAQAEREFQSQQTEDANRMADAKRPYEMENAKLQNEIANSKIDPSAYVKNMSTGGKIMSAIGLMMGGLGAGMTHGQNVAAQYFQNQVDADINAQKANLGNKNSLLSHNMAMLHNMNEAEAMTRMQTNTMLASHMRELAGTAANENVKGALNSLSGQLMAKNADIIQRVGMQKAAMGDQSSNMSPARQLFARKQAGLIDEKQYEQGNKEITSAQEAIKLKGDLLKSFHDLDSQVLAGNLSPVDRKSAINAFAGRLAKVSEGRFNLEESKQQIDSIMPAGFESASTTRPKKLQRLNDLVDMAINTPTLEGMGITMPGASGVSQQSAPEIKKMGGVPHMKVPGGWKPMPYGK